MRIAVTGATGFVGRRLVHALLSEGHRVAGSARSPTGESRLPDDVLLVRGDVRDIHAMRDLVRDCEAVVHLAASYDPSNSVEDIIVEGTRTLTQAARDEGCNRFVLVSCLGAEAATPNPFYRAKWQAEMLVRATDIPWAILRPSLVLGQGDPVTAGMAAFARLWPVVPVPGRGDVRCQPVDVDDLTRCIVASLQSDALVGQSVSVGGSLFLTYRELVDLVGGCLGVVRVKALVPPSWLPALAPVAPRAARPLLSPHRLARFLTGVVASPGIVDRTFGFQPRSVVDRLPHYVS